MIRHKSQAGKCLVFIAQLLLYGVQQVDYGSFVVIILQLQHDSTTKHISQSVLISILHDVNCDHRIRDRNQHVSNVSITGMRSLGVKSGVELVLSIPVHLYIDNLLIAGRT